MIPTAGIERLSKCTEPTGKHLIAMKGLVHTHAWPGGWPVRRWSSSQQVWAHSHPRLAPTAHGSVARSDQGSSP